MSFRPWKCKCGYVNVIWLRCLKCARLKKSRADSNGKVTRA